MQLRSPATPAATCGRCSGHPTVGVRDSESCAVWTAATHGAQQGAAFRITTTSGTTRAITVSKNVYGGWVWVFNIHSWTRSPGSQPVVERQIGSINLYRTLFVRKVAAPYPWHFCARVIGRQLAVKVWLNGERTPGWGDSAHSGSITLPADAVRSGYTGWYIGHLEPRGTADFAGLTTNLLTSRPGDVAHR